MATKLFVGNLNFRTQPEVLATFFREAGEVLNVEIIARNNYASRGYGFVDMATEEGAQKALNELNHKELDERLINIELAKPRQIPAEGQAPAEGRRGSINRPRPFRPRRRRGTAPGAAATSAQIPVERAPPTPSPTRVYVNNLPWAIDDEQLMAHFATFEPKTANVVRRPNGMSAGYGFLEFEDSEHQQAAINALNGTSILERPITVKVANAPPTPGQARPRPRARSMSGRRPGFFPRRRGSLRPRGPPPPLSTTRVFVANLPFSVTDEELNEMFESLSIKEAHVAKTSSGGSRGFGFVDFENEAAQKEAIDKFNGQTYGERPISVRVAREPRPAPEATEAPAAEAPAQ
eukprot:gnl/Trimastix_PCT/85.p1 GENE.gnl/Trimastix_PCT/85~~gnl/Trimastix_PCT/85.p1  ORF type:complete len:349 (+),score=81.92 gnl/Trimastix_PCT/85:98-1144(+)